MKETLKKIAQAILVLVVVYFVYRQVSDNWDTLVAYDWTFSPGWFVISVVAHLLTLLMMSQVWVWIISGFGYRVPLSYAFKIAYLANLGRYIPGKIWQVFGMVYLAKQIGIKEEKAAASWVIALLFALPSAFTVGMIGLLISSDLFFSSLDGFLGAGLYLLGGISFMFSLLLIFSPNHALIVYNFILKLFKRKPVSFEISTSSAIKVYTGYFVAWVLYGVSFWLFMRSILPESPMNVIEATTAFVLAYQLGYLAFFAPGGIGMREWVLTAAMGPSVGGIASGVAIAARLWNLLVEVIATIVAWLIKFKK